LTEKKTRSLAVENGTVQCTAAKREPIEKCRFCVHSTHFVVKGRRVSSPARAYCTMQRATEAVRLAEVEAVICDDLREEGFGSIMSIIS
jgi:hypothetical protein